MTADDAALLTREGKVRPVRMSCWRLPPAASEDADALARFVEPAREAARSAAAARPPRSRGPRSGRAA